MWIRADIDQLKFLSENLYHAPKGSTTKYLFHVHEFDGIGYAQLTEPQLKVVEFEYQPINDAFTLSGEKVSSMEVLTSLDIVARKPRKLNTAVDVYFQFREKTHGIRFNDWNVFRVMSDEQCARKIRSYLIENNEIKHPATSLE